MVKKIVFILSVILVSFSLTACNGSSLEDALDSIVLPSKISSDIELPKLGDEFSDMTVTFDSLNDNVLSDDLKVYRQYEDVSVQEVKRFI